ncbi:uncharacterized protein LOC129542346 [Moschus berezovskii]|uniref:uncharacterized protein LOC129542346 n=1 Tax=Moschus berezovskii TaxID=68408 RepID=UPI0024450BF5|nr:uncharacterized protein LOC129542346 [Moschus berezovskii]
MRGIGFPSEHPVGKQNTCKRCLGTRRRSADLSPRTAATCDPACGFPAPTSRHPRARKGAPGTGPVTQTPQASFAMFPGHPCLNLRASPNSRAQTTPLTPISALGGSSLGRRLPLEPVTGEPARRHTGTCRGCRHPHTRPGYQRGRSDSPLLARPGRTRSLAAGCVPRAGGAGRVEPGARRPRASETFQGYNCSAETETPILWPPDVKN